MGIQDGWILTPLRADLLATIAKPDGIVDAVDTFDLPLKITPVGGLKNVYLGILGICPTFFGESRGIKANPARRLSGESHVIIRNSTRTGCTSENRPGGLDVAGMTRIGSVVIGVARTDLAPGVDEKLCKLEAGGNHGFHDAIFIGRPIAFQLSTTTDGDFFIRIGRENDFGVEFAGVFVRKDQRVLEIVRAFPNQDPTGRIVLFPCANERLRPRKCLKWLLFGARIFVVSGGRDVERNGCVWIGSKRPCQLIFAHANNRCGGHRGTHAGSQKVSSLHEFTNWLSQIIQEIRGKSRGRRVSGG